MNALGVDPVHHLPGVGENLQDHLQMRMIFKVSGVKTMNTEYQSIAKRVGMGLQYAFFRRGPLTMAPSQLGAFTRSSSDFETPNIQYHIQPLSLDKFGDPLHTFDAFTVTGLSVNRYIHDPADWERSRWISPLGASGHPASPHYADQAQLWANVEFIPQLWDWQEIKEKAETTMSRASMEPQTQATKGQKSKITHGQLK